MHCINYNILYICKYLKILKPLKCNLMDITNLTMLPNIITINNKKSLFAYQNHYC